MGRRNHVLDGGPGPPVLMGILRNVYQTPLDKMETSGLPAHQTQPIACSRASCNAYSPYHYLAAWSFSTWVISVCLQAEEADFTADLHGNWTLENAKSRLHQFLQTNHIKADYKYTVVGPDHSKYDWQTACLTDCRLCTQHCILLTCSAVVLLKSFEVGLKADMSFGFHFSELCG